MNTRISGSEARASVSAEFAAGVSLAAAIARTGSAVEVLRNSGARPTVFPVAPEFSNWRSEQRSWRETCALLDQSHHMTDLFLSGPDAGRLLSDFGINSFTAFGVNKAKQFVGVNSDGQVIGDAILFHLDENEYDLVGHPMVIDWVQFNLETGSYDATFERDGNSIVRKGTPKLYRYELQGPTAVDIVRKVTGSPVPDVKFFNMTEFTIADLRVRALRHGMAGQPGFELFGPWADGDAVRDALISAGEEFGIVPVGAKAYSSANLESGWIPSPLPAIFTGDGMREYREWLPATSAGSLGGSFSSKNVEDYYITPFDLGYDRSIAYDHDFVGRDALQRMEPSRKKVTLIWNADDVAAAMRSLFEPGLPAKYIDLPKSRYALYQADAVLLNDVPVGLSMDCGYIVNEQVYASLGTLDLSAAEPGTQVTVLWGEDPNSTKPSVEPHRQVSIRATVAPAPYVQFARSAYRSK